MVKNKTTKKFTTEKAIRLLLCLEIADGKLESLAKNSGNVALQIHFTVQYIKAVVLANIRKKIYSWEMDNTISISCFYYSPHTPIL